MTENLRRVTGAFADLGERSMPVVEPPLTLVAVALLAAPALIGLFIFWAMHPLLAISAAGLLTWWIMAALGGDGASREGRDE